MKQKFVSFALATAVALLVLGSNLPAEAATVLIDFGGTNALTSGQPDTWNNAAVISSPVASGQGVTGVLVADLLDTTGGSTGVALTITDAFNHANTNGTTTSSLGYPASATSDSLFGSTGLFNGYTDNGQAIFQLSGLNPSLTYDFTFYASRTGVGDNRETRYSVAGLNSGFGDLNAANNVDNTVSVLSIAPDLSGVITIAVAAGPNNNNANQFYYLGVMEMVSVPEPGSGVMLAFAGLALAAVRRRTAARPLLG